jgi:[FeFe] hydrogenase H-cluster maturation GTPase HydF
LDVAQRDAFLHAFKSAIEKVLPGLVGVENILEGLAFAGDWVAHVVPIDSQAPKGRLILPQVMTLRSALDADCRNMVTTEKEFASALADMKTAPRPEVYDSQVVEKVMAALPQAIPCTTYSILMARMKGGLAELAAGAAAIDRLRDGDRVLIAEVCTHHAGDDDIGRVKIPNLLKRKTGKTLEFEWVSGRDFADDAKRYALIVHCGGGMATRGQMAGRIAQARAANVPITNYGVCIAYCQGVMERALKPFGETP